MEEIEITWVVVADSSKARFFEAESSAGALRELRRMEHPANRLGAEGAIEGEVSADEQEARRFARELANRLQLEGRQKSFTRLVIAAPAQFLEHLRRYLSTEVRDLVADELAKDIVNGNPDQVRRNLPTLL